MVSSGGIFQGDPLFLRSLAIASALVLGAPPCVGAADSDLPVHSGLWSLEVGVQAFNGSSVGAGLAGKYHIAERSAIRLGLITSVNGSDGDRTTTEHETVPYDTTQTIEKLSSSQDDRNITIFTHWVRYVDVDEHFGMTLQAGPTVHWSSQEFFDSDVLGPDQLYQSSQDQDLWEYGLDLQAGFEWFFSHQLSIAGRFGFTGLRTEEKRTSDQFLSSSYQGFEQSIHDETHSNGWVIRTTPPLISLNAYW